MLQPSVRPEPVFRARHAREAWTSAIFSRSGTAPYCRCAVAPGISPSKLLAHASRRRPPRVAAIAVVQRFLDQRGRRNDWFTRHGLRPTTCPSLPSNKPRPRPRSLALPSRAFGWSDVLASPHILKTGDGVSHPWVRIPPPPPPGRWPAFGGEVLSGSSLTPSAFDGIAKLVQLAKRSTSER